MSNMPNNQRKKTLLDDWRQPHPATLQPMDGGKYPAQGVFQQKNNGAIVFKISDGVFKQGNGGSNHKEVELNYADRGALFEGVMEAATNPNFDTRQLVIQKKTFIKSGGMSKISDNPIVQGTFTIIRDKNGVITLVYSKGDYKAPLVFRGPNDTVLYMKNEAGERVEDRGTMSRWAARAWVAFHRGVLDDMERAAWEPRPPRDNGGQNNGGRNNGGGNGYNNGGGGGNSYDSDFEEPEF